ncbi:cardiolipin synthase B [Nibricoccus aquaticus]|uniref:Cardiolipin synthase B n=2 Tax=Nibricoccus aquaticus TaxID=2576891 RepID=A0A290Q8F9_9BACT|nr:cardiolipin synthase B [Nibricoccus aquaticus]
MLPFLSRLRRRHASTAISKPHKSPAPRMSPRRYWLTVTACVITALGAYFWITSAKILREPVEVSYGPLDPVFPDTLGPLLGAEFSGGNKITTLINGERFFPVMLDAIRRAQKTVTLETYIWSSGKISDQFIDALCERARAGIKVHVLADGMGSLKFDHDEQERMKKCGVEFLIYAREHWWNIKPNINHRTHRKILVVDGKVGFTGGMCIDDRWLGDADSEKVWRETQIRVEGPAVRQMQAVFVSNWLQTTSRLLVGPDYFPESKGVGDTLAQCYKSGRNENPENARIAHLLAIASARKSIKIAQAYFVPDDLAIDMLLAARKRGIEVDVIVPAINDSRFGRAASRSRWGKLLEAGVRIHQYLPAMYHCKVMIVDDVFSTVGSVNFDNRSFAINDEIAVNIIDEVATRDLLKSFNADLKRSKPLPFDEFTSRPWYIKTADHLCGLFRSQL